VDLATDSPQTHGFRTGDPLFSSYLAALTRI